MSTGSVSQPQIWTINQHDSDIHSSLLNLQSDPASVRTTSAQPARPAPTGEWGHSGGERWRENSAIQKIKEKKILFNCCISGSSFGKEEDQSVFLAGGAISIEYDERNTTCLLQEETVVTHSHLMKPCLVLRDTFTKQCHAQLKTPLHNRLESSFFSPSDGTEEKIARKWLRGSCPKTGEVPADIRGCRWRSGFPPSGSQVQG